MKNTGGSNFFNGVWRTKKNHPIAEVSFELIFWMVGQAILLA
jgi:hypothetical protein